MRPVSPVVPGWPVEAEICYAKDQPEYLQLPALTYGSPEFGHRLSRWKMSWAERLHVLVTGHVFLHVMTFNTPLQPVMITVNPPSDLSVRPPVVVDPS